MMTFVVVLILAVMSWMFGTTISNVVLTPNTLAGCGNTMFFNAEDIVGDLVPALPGCSRTNRKSIFTQPV